MDNQLFNALVPAICQKIHYGVATADIALYLSAHGLSNDEAYLVYCAAKAAMVLDTKTYDVRDDEAPVSSV